MTAFDFSRRPARRMRTPINYQDTSREAWNLVDSSTLDGRILDALADGGIVGRMCWQIEDQIGASHQSVSGNLRHLVERGLVVRSERRGKTPTGRSAYYWVHIKHAASADNGDKND